MSWTKLHTDQKTKNWLCYTQNSKQVLIVLMAKTSFNFEITSKISSLWSAMNIMYWNDSSQIYCDTRFEFKLVKHCSEYLILLRTYINIYLKCHQIIFKAKISKKYIVRGIFLRYICLYKFHWDAKYSSNLLNCRYLVFALNWLFLQ